MWKTVKRHKIKDWVGSVELTTKDYHMLDNKQRLLLLHENLPKHYEIYIRSVGFAIMLYDTLLNEYYDEEQFGDRNLINFWNSYINKNDDVKTITIDVKSFLDSIYE